MKYLAPLGRLLYSLIFLDTISHFKHPAVEHAHQAGVPMAFILVPLSGAMAIAGWLMIIFAYKAKWGAWLIVLFLIPVTFTMHRFWTESDSQKAEMQRTMFLKNISMLGAALLITQMGSGPVSFRR